jgi:hypothetical protein
MIMEISKEEAQAVLKVLDKAICEGGIPNDFGDDVAGTIMDTFARIEGELNMKHEKKDFIAKYTLHTYIHVSAENLEEAQVIADNEIEQVLHDSRSEVELDVQEEAP